MFGQLFGGERFQDYIGEVSLLRDFGKASEIMMTEEEKEELEKQMKEANLNDNPTTATTPSTVEAEKKETTTPTATATESTTIGEKPGVEKSDSHVALHNSEEKSKQEAAAKKSKRPQMTPEQKAQLEAFEKEKEESEEKRVEDLTRKLIERIRPFVEVSLGHSERGRLVEKVNEEERQNGSKNGH